MLFWVSRIWATKPACRYGGLKKSPQVTALRLFTDVRRRHRRHADYQRLSCKPGNQ